MSAFAHRLTEGYVLRHVPPAGNVGLDVAILDISQDFLLTRLEAVGFFDLAVFKGGTAIRKLIAGQSGRFSTDLDFGLISRSDDRQTVASLLAETLDGAELGPFRFSADRRHDEDRWKIRVDSEFGSPPQTMKVDIGPLAWLQPVRRELLATSIHSRYDFDLLSVPAMAFAEMLAEKIARLNRRSTARDAYDLVWSASTSPHSQFDRDLVRRVAILKIWADGHGLGGALPMDGAQPFEPGRWLRTRDDWDDEGIGLLTSPAPDLLDLGRRLQKYYAWMGDLSEAEQTWAVCDPRDRERVIEAVASTPNAAATADELRSYTAE